MTDLTPKQRLAFVEGMARLEALSDSCRENNLDQTVPDKLAFATAEHLPTYKQRLAELKKKFAPKLRKKSGPVPWRKTGEGWNTSIEWFLTAELLIKTGKTRDTALEIVGKICPSSPGQEAIKKRYYEVKNSFFGKLYTGIKEQSDASPADILFELLETHSPDNLLVCNGSDT